MKTTDDAVKALRHLKAALVADSGEENQTIAMRAAFIRLNTNIENNASLADLHEPLLLSFLEKLETLSQRPSPWRLLTLARLVELTLLCAFNYAENGCSECVGDLLFNPQRIHIHINGQPRPMVKQRHTAISTQLQEYLPETGSIVAWLRDNTISEIIEKPILPHLMDLLKQAGCPDIYLNFIDGRMSQVAIILGQTALTPSMNPDDSPAGRQQCCQAPVVAERLFPEPDLTLFKKLGEYIRDLDFSSDSFFFLQRSQPFPYDVLIIILIYLPF